MSGTMWELNADYCMRVSQTFQNHLHDIDKETKAQRGRLTPGPPIHSGKEQRVQASVQRLCVFSRPSCLQQALGGYVVILRAAFRFCSNCAKAVGGYEDQADVSSQDWEDSPGKGTVGICGS